MTAHDYAIVAWATEQPVIIKDKDHPDKPTEKFPLYELNADTILYDYNGNVITAEDGGRPKPPKPDDGSVPLPVDFFSAEEVF